MALNINFQWKEDGAKMLKAAFLGVLIVLATTEFPKSSVEWKVFVGLALGAAARGILALFEAPSIPAHEVAQLKPTASDDSATKVAEAKAKP